MSQIERKIANQNYEEAGGQTTHSTNRHGLSRAQRRIKRYYNRIARRKASKLHYDSQ